MKKLFNDGKVFGKYNLIDFLVVLILAAGIIIGAGAVGLKIYNDRNADNNEMIVMKFYAEEVSDFVVENMELGGELMDVDKNIPLGFATDIQINDSVTYGGITSGQYELVNKEGYKSVVITSEVEGVKNALGVLVNNFQYGVGHSMTLRVGDAKIYLRVYDIALKSDMEASEKQEASKQKPILISLEANEVNNFVAANIKEGDLLYDYTNGVALGKVVSYEISDAKVYVTTDSGKIVTSSKEGFNTVKIIVEIDAEISQEGTATIESKPYYLAKEFYLRVGNALMGNSTITDISLK